MRKEVYLNDVLLRLKILRGGGALWSLVPPPVPTFRDALAAQ